MSQDKESLSKALANPLLANGLRRLVLEKRIKRATRAMNVVGNREGVKNRVKDLLQRKPNLFAELRNLGKTTGQIIEHYYDKIVK